MGSSQISDRYARASRMFGYALTLGDDAHVWDGFTFVLRHGLSGYDRAATFASVARSLHPEDRAYILSEIESREGAGMPLPPLYDPMVEATWWAGIATIEERRSVLMASYVSLPEREQCSFLSFGGSVL